MDREQRGVPGLAVVVLAAALLMATLALSACRRSSASSTSSPRDPRVRWSVPLGAVGAVPAVALGPDGTIYAMAAVDSDEPPAGYASAKGAHRLCLFALDTGGAVVRRVAGRPFVGAPPQAWVRVAPWGAAYAVDANGGLYGLLPAGLERFVAAEESLLGPPAIGARGELFVGGTREGVLGFQIDAGATAQVAARTGGGTRPPAIGADETLYLTYGARLYAVSARDEVRWVVQAPAGRPVFSEGTIFVAGGRVLAAFATNGEKLWEYESEAPFLTAPALVSGGKVYAAAAPSLVLAVQNGRKLWSWVAETRIAAEIATDEDGAAYVSAGRSLYCLSSEGRRRWVLRLPTTAGTAAPSTDGIVYVQTIDGQLHAVEPPTEVSQ